MPAARALLLLPALLLAGCGAGERPHATSPSEPAAIPTRVATATPPPAADAPPAREVTFRASDGRSVPATLRSAGRRAPVVLLLHQAQRDRREWDAFAPELHRAGLTTLAYDAREGIDETEHVQDLDGAVRYVRRTLGRRPIGIVGSSIGAATALYAGADRHRRTFAATVLLSTADSPSFVALQTEGRYRPHDVLFVADEGDASSTGALLEGARRSRLRRTREPGHGTVLFEDAAVRRDVVDWLRDRLR